MRCARRCQLQEVLSCVRTNFTFFARFFCIRRKYFGICHNFGVRRNERDIVNSVRTSKDIGAAIRAERKHQQLTQTELADLCAVSLSFVSNLENGKETTELGKTLKVLNTLGLDLTVEKRGERSWS